MITISLALALIPYAIVLLFFLLFATIDVYHMIHYGETTKVSYMVTLVFVIVSLAVLMVTFSLLREVDWNQSVSIVLPFFTSAPPAAF